MNSFAIDKPYIKYTLRIFGIFITIFALIGTIDGIALGLGGIEKKNIWAISFGLGTLFSWIGIIGAWFRLSIQYPNVKRIKVALTVRFLQIGVVGSLLLTTGSIGIFSFDVIFLPATFMLLALGGVYLIYATPKGF